MSYSYQGRSLKPWCSGLGGGYQMPHYDHRWQQPLFYRGMRQLSTLLVDNQKKKKKKAIKMVICREIAKQQSQLYHQCPLTTQISPGKYFNCLWWQDEHKRVSIWTWVAFRLAFRCDWMFLGDGQTAKESLSWETEKPLWAKIERKMYTRTVP